MEKINPGKTDDGIRINKYLSEGGYCSRRQADDLIAQKKVYVDGVLAVMGQKIYKNQKVTVLDGRNTEIKKENELILIALNKPEGIECTSDRKNKDNIIDYINYRKRIFPVGRLDKNSEGLILLTNDGYLSDLIMRGANGHEKEYVVTVDRDIDEDFVYKMENGIHIIDEEHNIDVVTRKCKVKKTGKRQFEIILTQGINRQIRRMCLALGYKVIKLKRTRIINILLGDLKTGQWREVPKKDIQILMERLKAKGGQGNYE